MSSRRGRPGIVPGTPPHLYTCRRDGGLVGRRRYLLAVAGAGLLAWVGLWVHNVADLPGQTPLSPESAGPGLVTLLLLALWFLSRSRQVAGWLLLGWALLNLVGGAILTVLPLPILPFAPEQSLRHYLFHVLYGVCQLPLIVALLVSLRGHAASVRVRVGS